MVKTTQGDMRRTAWSRTNTCYAAGLGEQQNTAQMQPNTTTTTLTKHNNNHINKTQQPH